MMSVALILLAAAAVAAWLAMAEPSVPGPLDAQLILQDTTTKTASFDSAALDLGAGYGPGGPGQQMTAVVNVTAADRANGDETYAFKLQESDDNSAFTDASASASVPVSGTTATLGVVLVKGVVKKRYVRLSLAAAGTTPSATYKAWLKPASR